jgi:sulfite exporter TauE/SafE
MIDALMLFVGGLLGSSHCVGMCGGFALALGARPGFTSNLWRQSVYGLGRVFTYSVFGAVAGYGGWRVGVPLRSLVNVQAVLCIAAGVLLIVQGLYAAGMFRQRLAARPGCLGPSLFAGLLGSTRAQSVFLAGMVNGLLPCGLVYAYLALAGTSGDLWRGAMTMACFGLGTMPVMTLIGCGGLALSLATRKRVLHLAAWCVVLTGVLTVGRGFGFLEGFGLLPGPACPHCRGEP